MMNAVNRLTKLLLMITLVVMSACVTKEKDNDNDALSLAAQREIQRRSDTYLQRKMEECYENTLQRASDVVDSILFEQALFIGGDTLDRPFRPMRPLPETFYSPIEKVPLKPFLRRDEFVSPFQRVDSLMVDSLRRVDSLHAAWQDSMKRAEKK